MDQRFEEIKKLRDSGTRLTEALKRVHMSASTYYKEKDGQTVKTKRAYKRKPRMITLDVKSASAPQGKMICLLGDVESILSAIRGLV